MVKAEQQPGQGWRKSKRSMNHGDCVEVGQSGPNNVSIRDTKDRQGPTLKVSGVAWQRFAEDIKKSPV
ncbi:MAG TPA: DUF397 domain-containing protein [Candidatus Saccharimonadales bacterium]|nr:DUF397 domain-containing protein [Candidatus Saccharimonadales bacterium]